jgi:hypothetical protein
MPELAPTATLLAKVNATSSSEVDGVDYDTRLDGYRELKAPAWLGLGGGSDGAAPLVHHCFADLRNADDLVLRHGAAGALAQFVSAAANKAEPNGEALFHLVPRLLFPQVSGKGAPATGS